MKLSVRLSRVLELLDKDKELVDIGCDHGYLSIAFASISNKKVYALDNKQEPLDSCIQNLIESNMSDKVETLLSDGLTKFNKQAEQIAICGMGGNNIIDILSYGLNNHKLKDNVVLVLQPNNNEEHLRTFLTNNNFKIIDELLVDENDVIYEVIKAIKGDQNLSELDIKFGPIIRKNKNELFVKKWNLNKDYLESLFKKIPENSDTISKLENIKKEIKIIEDEVNEI